MRVRVSYRALKALHRDFPLLPLGGIGSTAPGCKGKGKKGKCKILYDSTPAGIDGRIAAADGVEGAT